jgi:hypothetical protein
MPVAANFVSDLDRLQVDRGPAKDAASYYIQASESGGEPPGRWWGPGARALGFEPARPSSANRMTCCSANAKPLTAPSWAGLRVMAGRRLTCTPSCWPPSRTPLPNANAPGKPAWPRPGPAPRPRPPTVGPSRSGSPPLGSGGQLPGHGRRLPGPRARLRRGHGRPGRLGSHHPAAASAGRSRRRRTAPPASGAAVHPASFG